MKITNDLIKLKDDKYREFHYKLIPNVNKDTILGVRVPNIRKVFKKYYNSKDLEIFINNLPHTYYDENMLHGIIISNIKDYNLCIMELERFFPFIDNWAVCDSIIPKIFMKNKNDLLKKIKIWIKSNNTFEVRFGIKMLMNFYLDSDYNIKILDIPLSIKSDNYYVNMMKAWFYTDALIKQYNDTIKYLENNKLDIWVHNKTISKAIDSFRISKDRKEYLRSLRRKII